MAEKWKYLMESSKHVAQPYVSRKKTVGQKRKTPLGSMPLPRKEPRTDALVADFQDFQDKESCDKFVSIFSKKSIICERFVEPKPMKMAGIESHIANYGWNPLFKLRGTYHDLEVCMFYVNARVENETEFSFVTEVYGVPIIVNPDILAIELGIPRVRELEATYHVRYLSTDSRAQFVIWMGFKEVN